MQNLRILACVMAALGSIAIAGCGSDNDCDNNINCATGGQLRVQNQSDFEIDQIHVAPVGSTTWGDNLIPQPPVPPPPTPPPPPNVLAPGQSLTITVSCGHYDALLIDQAGEQCTLHDVVLCGSTADWIIRNNTCSTFTNRGPAPGSSAGH